MEWKLMKQAKMKENQSYEYEIGTCQETNTKLVYREPDKNHPKYKLAKQFLETNEIFLNMSDRDNEKDQIK